MLNRPSIIKMPLSSYPLNPNNVRGCNGGTYYAPTGGSSCSTGFACQPYGPNLNDCVDANYCGSTLGWGAGVTAAVGIIGVGATLIT